MSMYNLLFGVNPNSEVLLAILGFKEGDVERYRDCGFSDDGIFIYTRTGGSNRDDYPNEKLRKSPYYLKDKDDDYDNTYATFYFRYPDKIAKDCQKFRDVRKNGISGKLIQWILKTLEREPTESDKYSELWDRQNKYVQQVNSGSLHESNGHTITPLDDRTLEKLLEMQEENNGEEISYSIRPYKLIISENTPRWSYNENDMCRIKIEYTENWEVDDNLWNHWTSKFEHKYPKSIENIKKALNLNL